jgi:hypothetical protein
LNDEIKKKNQNIQKDKKIAIVRKKGLRPPKLTYQTHELGYEIGIAQ